MIEFFLLLLFLLASAIALLGIAGSVLLLLWLFRLLPQVKQ